MFLKKGMSDDWRPDWDNAGDALLWFASREYPTGLVSALRFGRYRMPESERNRISDQCELAEAACRLLAFFSSFFFVTSSVTSEEAQSLGRLLVGAAHPLAKEESVSFSQIEEHKNMSLKLVQALCVCSSDLHTRASAFSNELGVAKRAMATTPFTVYEDALRRLGTLGIKSPSSEKLAKAASALEEADETQCVMDLVEDLYISDDQDDFKERWSFAHFLSQYSQPESYLVLITGELEALIKESSQPFGSGFSAARRELSSRVLGGVDLLGEIVGWLNRLNGRAPSPERLIHWIDAKTRSEVLRGAYEALDDATLAEFLALMISKAWVRAIHHVAWGDTEVEVALAELEKPLGFIRELRTTTRKLHPLRSDSPEYRLFGSAIRDDVLSVLDYGSEEHGPNDNSDDVDSASSLGSDGEEDEIPF